MFTITQEDNRTTNLPFQRNRNMKLFEDSTLDLASIQYIFR